MAKFCREIDSKFLSSTLHLKTISAPSLDYGKNHEKDAKARYLKDFPSRHTHSCGLVVSKEFAFSDESPDGKVLEIKCPYFARNLTIKEACDNIRDFFLFKNDDLITLKNTHANCAQVQGQLLITGCSFCYFVFYTQKICLYREYSLICHSWPQCLKNCVLFFQNLCKAIFFPIKMYSIMLSFEIKYLLTWSMCLYSNVVTIVHFVHQFISYINFVFPIQCTIQNK